jgi:hypothetical protein
MGFAGAAGPSWGLRPRRVPGRAGAARVAHLRCASLFFSLALPGPSESDVGSGLGAADCSALAAAAAAAACGAGLDLQRGTGGAVSGCLRIWQLWQLWNAAGALPTGELR